jgi:flagellar protein FlbD
MARALKFRGFWSKRSLFWKFKFADSKTDRFFNEGRSLAMIAVTRLNNTPLVINPDLIVFMEETPDTIITLSNGEKIAVQEKVSEVIRRVITFRRRIFNPWIPID